MLKFGRVVWVAIALAAVVGTIGVGTTVSYLKTARRQLGEELRDLVPIKFEIQRLAGMTDDLVRDIQANQKVAAQLEVEIEYLQREIDAQDKALTQSRAEMQKLRDALRESKEEFIFGGQKFSRADVEKDLGRRLQRYRDGQTLLESKKQLLQARQTTLQAAVDKIREFQHQRELLAQKVESLKAELALVEAQQAAGKFHFDASQLGEAKRLAEDIEKRIRVTQRMIAGQQLPGGEIPVAVDDRPASEQFDELFGNKSEAVATSR